MSAKPFAVRINPRAQRATARRIASLALLILLSMNARAAAPLSFDPVTSPNWAWTAETSGGVSYVASAGDVNGDGYPDVLVASRSYVYNGISGAGRVCLYYGSKDGLSTTPAWVVYGTTSDWFGRCVACAGDVNGDGYSDIIISQGYLDESNEYSATRGHVYVWYGSKNGLKANPTPATADWKMDGPTANETFGFSCATAGDVNGDGYADIIIGAPTYDSPTHSAGRAYVYYGSATGLAATPAWTLQGTQFSQTLGWSVASAGDVNHDGYGDIIVGSPSRFDYSRPGSASVFHGSAAGLSAAPNWTASLGVTYDEFGYGVGCAGDVNKDGYSDVIISAPQYSGAQHYQGAAFVYHGSSAGLPASPNWSVFGRQAGDDLGSAVSTAGDFNGDGYSDVIVGTYLFDDVTTNDGAAAIYYGTPSGLTTASTKLEYTQHTTGGFFGLWAASLKDINKDGCDDVVVLAPNTGAAYGYYGKPQSAPPTTTTTDLIQIVSVTQTPEKKVDIVFNLAPGDPAPANGYDITVLAMATTLDCAGTSGTADSAFDDITPYVTGSLNIGSGSGLLTWDVKGMTNAPLKAKYWKAGVSVLFRLKATPKN